MNDKIRPELHTYTCELRIDITPRFINTNYRFVHKKSVSQMFVRRMIVPNKKFNLEMNDLNILNSTYIFSDIIKFYIFFSISLKCFC